jgi:WXG100 family type VII secretion target
MAKFGATPDTLDALAKAILQADETSQAKIRAVRDAAETVGATWTGSANVAFRSLIERFNDDAMKVSKALNDIAEQISESSKTYLQNDQAQQQELGSVAQRLG